jgi:uncharacterized OB-fold protein
MSNTENTQEIAVTANTEIAVAEQQLPTNFAQLLEASASVDKLKEVVTLTNEYIELEKPSDSFKGIFVGFIQMSVTDKVTGELRTMSSAQFLINKKMFINGGVNLVGQLKKSNVPSGTPVKVTYTRKDGNVKVYELTLLG